MIPAWVAPYIGKPFRDRGRGPDAYDCYGLVRAVLADQYAVRDLPSYAARYERVNDHLTVAKLFFQETTSARWRRVALQDATPPDVLLISLAGRQHVGILVTLDQFLHVLPGRETCIERLRPHWAVRVDGVYRHEALTLV